MSDRRSPLAERLYLRVAAPILSRVGQLRRDVDSLMVEVGRLHTRALQSAEISTLAEAEFSVFSQFGDDGIIHYLTQRVPLGERWFVEFGVEDYRESNTRYLATSGGWQGLILDGGDQHIRFAEESGLRMMRGLQAAQEFITADNINGIFAAHHVPEDLALLSIDIDGNDYWVLEALTHSRPRILIVEYNSIFGPEHAVTVPYRPDFSRAQAHHSLLYFGASLAALCDLAGGKGYRFVGSNSAGINAYFVREDVAGNLPGLTAAEGWVRSLHRESRGCDGAPTYLDPHTEGLALLRELPLVDVRSGQILRIGRLFGADGA